MHTFALSFTFESFILSIFLAYIFILINDSKIFTFQTNHTLSVDTLVKKRTQVLETSLIEKDVLYQELNHRIKNNLMMILSLVKLQIIKDEKKEVKEALMVTKHRIESIFSLYESLLLDNKNLNVSTLEYFTNICEMIQMDEVSDVEIVYDIHIDLEVNTLIYVGLVLNELVTNAFKYAFEEKGTISISLYKKDKEILFIVEDDGQGFVQKNTESLGLTIIESLVKGQLKGSLEIWSEKGTTVCMSWKDA